MGTAKWLIRIGGGLALTSIMLIAFLSLEALCQEPCLVLGLDIPPDVYRALWASLPVFVVFGVSLIVAGLMMKGGKTHSNRSSG